MRLRGSIQLFLSLFFLILFVFLITNVSALANPAVKSCLDHGNSYKIKHDASGGEFGVCVVNGKEIDEWQFYRDQLKQQSSSNNYSKNLVSKTSGNISLRGLSRPVIESSSNFTIRGDSPSNMDWRNKTGVNWVSPIRHQGSEGTCWAFSSVGIVESRAKIDLNNSAYNLDLSEQDVAACNPNYTRSNWSGGYESDALDYITYGGITTESFFAYTGHNTLCSAKPANSPVIKTSNYVLISANANSIKQAINDYGPITMWLYADDDFQAYTGGIYTHQTITWSGGYHSVDIVGYNDTGNYWICKNSWGSSWGESGFFRIDYSESVYDSNAWYSNPSDNRMFFLDGSYYVSSTDITSPPTLISSTANTSFVYSLNSPINFSVYASLKSIKVFSNITLNKTTIPGNYSFSGLFSLVKTLSQLGCNSVIGQTCSVPINVTDDAGLSALSSINISLADNIAPTSAAHIASGEFKKYTNFSANITLRDNFNLDTAWLEGNFSGIMRNYTYGVNTTEINLSKSFNINLSGGNSFAYKWWFNDSYGNLNYSDWNSIYVINTPAANSTIPAINWTINSNFTLNLSQYFLDNDGDSLMFGNTSVNNLSIIFNQTTSMVTLIPYSNFNGTLYLVFYANDSYNITYSNNVSLNIFKPVILANNTYFNGQTTNFSNLTSFLNISLVLEEVEYGMINFSSVNLNFTNIDLDSYVNISDNRIEVNSSALPILNTTAILTFYNINYSYPVIFRNGVFYCENFCRIGYSNNTLVFNVTSFSVYESREANCSDGVQDGGENGVDCGGSCSACSSGRTGGGGGGSPAKKNVTNSTNLTVSLVSSPTKNQSIDIENNTDTFVDVEGLGENIVEQASFSLSEKAKLYISGLVVVIIILIVLRIVLKNKTKKSTRKKR
jgi:C1A family cysteine protease